FENQFGGGVGIQDEDRRLCRGIAQAADEFFERYGYAAGFDQDNIHAMALDAVEQRVGFGRIRLTGPLSHALFHGQPHRKILDAGMRLFPDSAVGDHECGSERHHAHLVAPAVGGAPPKVPPPEGVPPPAPPAPPDCDESVGRGAAGLIARGFMPPSGACPGAACCETTRCSCCISWTVI